MYFGTYREDYLRYECSDCGLHHRWLLYLTTPKHHELISSNALIEEFEEKLENKFDFSTAEIARARLTLKPIIQLVDPIPLASQVSRDPDDDIVLATAVAGNCEYIVTGDKDLLDLKEFQGIPIMKPREFGELIGAT